MRRPRRAGRSRLARRTASSERTCAKRHYRDVECAGSNAPVNDAGAAPRKCICRRERQLERVTHQRSAEDAAGGISHLRLRRYGVLQRRLVHQNKSFVGLTRKISSDSPGLQERLYSLISSRGALRLLRGVLRRLALLLSRGLDFGRIRK